jgi:hypothetical protein
MKRTAAFGRHSRGGCRPPAPSAYGWLNDVVAIGKIVSLNRTETRHVTYDIFAVR